MNSVYDAYFPGPDTLLLSLLFEVARKDVRVEEIFAIKTKRRTAREVACFSVAEKWDGILSRRNISLCCDFSLYAHRESIEKVRESGRDRAMRRRREINSMGFFSDKRNIILFHSVFFVF